MLKDAKGLIDSIVNMWLSIELTGILITFFIIVILLAFYIGYKIFAYYEKREMHYKKKDDALDECQNDRLMLKLKVDNFEKKVDELNKVNADLNTINKQCQGEIKTLINKHEAEIKGVLSAHTASNEQFVKAMANIVKNLT